MVINLVYDIFFLELQFLFCCLILYVNVRSIKDDEVIDMRVGALIICFKLNFPGTFLIAFPLWLDLSWRCEFFDFAFKSAINTIDYFDAIIPSLIPGFLWIFQIRPGFGLEICINKWSCKFYRQYMI